MSISIREILTEQTYPIRHQVLREGFPIESCHWESDNQPDSFHLGAFDKEKLIGIVSLVKTGNTEYQLRGMAVLKSHQGKNIGSLLIQKTEEKLKEKQISHLWLNARITAVNFYKKLNYSTQGDIFEIETVGKHIRMFKNF